MQDFEPRSLSSPSQLPSHENGGVEGFGCEAADLWTITPAGLESLGTFVSLLQSRTDFCGCSALSEELAFPEWPLTK